MRGGRDVMMIRYRHYTGKIMWRIETEPSSQQDEGERMNGLTDENVAEMVAALKVIKL